MKAIHPVFPHWDAQDRAEEKHADLYIAKVNFTILVAISSESLGTAMSDIARFHNPRFR